MEMVPLSPAVCLLQGNYFDDCWRVQSCLGERAGLRKWSGWLLLSGFVFPELQWKSCTEGKAKWNFKSQILSLGDEPIYRLRKEVGGLLTSSGRAIQRLFNQLHLTASRTVFPIRQNAWFHSPGLSFPGLGSVGEPLPMAHISGHGQHVTQSTKQSGCMCFTLNLGNTNVRGLTVRQTQGWDGDIFFFSNNFFWISFTYKNCAYLRYTARYFEICLHWYVYSSRWHRVHVCACVCTLTALDLRSTR